VLDYRDSRAPPIKFQFLLRHHTALAGPIEGQIGRRFVLSCVVPALPDPPPRWRQLLKIRRQFTRQNPAASLHNGNDIDPGEWKRGATYP
jgi:hypothetical protein